MREIRILVFVDDTGFEIETVTEYELAQLKEALDQIFTPHKEIREFKVERKYEN